MCSNIWILKFVDLSKSQMSKYPLNGSAYRYLSPLDFCTKLHMVKSIYGDKL